MSREAIVGERVGVSVGEGVGVTIVVVTRNRAGQLRQGLQRMSRIHPRPDIVVVDNGSSDGTAAMIQDEFPHVGLLALGRNRGSVARNLGVAAARHDVVAFADDDSWWAPGALERARKLFDSSPNLGLVAARILVGPQRRLDPTCRSMERSPLGCDHHGRRRILGFVACGAVVRRVAFRDSGGFERLLFFLGEEETLALDLAMRGWQLLYDPEVVALHHPEAVRDVAARRRRLVRNRFLASVLHRPWRSVLDETRRAVTGAGSNADVWRGLGQGIRLLPGALVRRRPVPAPLEAARRSLTDG